MRVQEEPDDFLSLAAGLLSAGLDSTGFPSEGFESGLDSDLESDAGWAFFATPACAP